MPGSPWTKWGKLRRAEPARVEIFPLCWGGISRFALYAGWDIQIFPPLWEPGLCSVSSTELYSWVQHFSGELGHLQAAGTKIHPNILSWKEPACSRALRPRQNSGEGGRGFISPVLKSRRALQETLALNDQAPSWDGSADNMKNV